MGQVYGPCHTYKLARATRKRPRAVAQEGLAPMHDQSTRHKLSPDHTALGAAVREVRARRGLSQEKLGFAVGLHRNYIGAIERGEINATFRTLLALTGGLVLPLSTLMLLYERNAREARA
jgi:DNA-binding XRE family transcriptional regulator